MRKDIVCDLHQYEEGYWRITSCRRLSPGLPLHPAASLSSAAVPCKLLHTISLSPHCTTILWRSQYDKMFPQKEKSFHSPTKIPTWWNVLQRAHWSLLNHYTLLHRWLHCILHLNSPSRRYPIPSITNPPTHIHVFSSMQRRWCMLFLAPQVLL